MRERFVRYVWLLVFEVVAVAEVVAVVAPPTMFSIFLDKNPYGGNFAFIIEPAVYNHLFFVTFLSGNFPPERWRRGGGGREAAFTLVSKNWTRKFKWKLIT